MNLPRQQQGLSLIEVLITAVVMGFGLLAVAALQTVAVRGNYTAYQYTQATNLARGMVERMRSNPLAAIDGDYNLKAGTTPSAAGKDCKSNTCTASELAEWDLADWFAELAPSDFEPGTDATAGRDTLPDGSAQIECLDAACDEQSLFAVTVFWDPERSGRTGTGCDPDNDADLACFRLVFQP